MGVKIGPGLGRAMDMGTDPGFATGLGGSIGESETRFLVLGLELELDFAWALALDVALARFALFDRFLCSLLGHESPSAPAGPSL
jgi:hypothetical protein